MIRTWGEFLSGEAWVKMPRFNAFCRKVNIINLKLFPIRGGLYKFERKFYKHSWKDCDSSAIFLHRENSCKVCLLFYCFLVMIASKSSILIHPLTLGFFLFTYNHSQNIYDRQKFTCEIAHYENFNFCFSEVFTSNDKIFISWRGPSTRQ